MRRLRAADGFAVPVVILGLTLVMMGLLGVAVDVWRVLGERAQLSALADSAALAGSAGIDVDALYAAEGVGVPLDVTAATAAACDQLRASGVAVCPGPGSEVTLDRAGVTVTLRRRVSLGPMRLLFLLTGGPENVEISAAASAAPFRRAAP